MKWVSSGSCSGWRGCSSLALVANCSTRASTSRPRFRVILPTRQSFSRNPANMAGSSFESLPSKSASLALESPLLLLTLGQTEATREDMREAKLPLAYRDSCANLLIPLNRCRVDTYYLPWKCEVSQWPLRSPAPPAWLLTMWKPTERATQLRKVPIRRVQEACGQDERAEGSQGGCQEQLELGKQHCVHIPNVDGHSAANYNMKYTRTAFACSETLQR